MTKSIIKPLMFVCFMILSVAARATADNIVNIGTVEGKPGDIVELQFGLQNSDDVSSIQISIPLDPRLELVDDSGIGTDRTSMHRVTVGVKDGKLNIFVYSMSMGNIATGSGTIAKLKLKLGNEPSDITLHADKVVLTDSNGATIKDVASTDGNASILCAKAEYSTMAIDYGRVPIRSSYQKSVKVNNVGNVPLVISGLKFSAAEFSCDETFPIEIAAGDCREIILTYAPVKRGGITEEVKFINNSVYKLNTVKLEALPFAVNELHVENAVGVADSVITVSLRMNNMDHITGFQFDFNMPQQLEYIDGSFILTSRKADHQLTVSMKDRTLRALAFSLTDSPFLENDGIIATFKIRLNGRYGTTLEAQKAVLTANIGGKETDVMSDKYSGYIDIQSPSMDVTGNIDFGRTPITQDAKASFRIKNNGSAPLRVERIVSSSRHLIVSNKLPIVIDSWSGVDVDVIFNDVEERDYNELLQLYTNDPGLRLHNIKVIGNRYSPNGITLSGTDVEPGDTIKLQIALSNNDVVSGLQFDLNYDADSFESLDKYELSDRAKGFSVTKRNIKEGKMRYFCYSLDGNEIAKGDGNVMTLMFAIKDSTPYGEYEFNVDDILLSTPGLVDKNSDAGNSVTINFVKPVRTVSITALENGTVTGAGTYDLGAEATLTAIANEGYSFVSWSDGNIDNPRVIIVNDNIELSVKFSPNSYILKYMVDGVEYKSLTLEYGVTIIPEAEPTKEGYTFSGWSEIPKTMPAYDVVVEGSFTINVHKVTWVIDGEIIAETEVKFGEVIVEPEVPVKDGYVFDGWDDIPETMPDHDITINGHYEPVSTIGRVMSGNRSVEAYTLQGVLIGKNMTLQEIDKLPKGIYIIDGNKYVKK